MEIKCFINKIFILLLCCFWTNIQLSADVKFGNTQSSITLKRHGTLAVESQNFTVNGGQINRTDNGNVSGNPFYFSRGILSSQLSSSFISGRYEPNVLNVEDLVPYYDPETETIFGAIEFGFNPNPLIDYDFIIANPGGLRYKLFLEPGSYYLRGQPLFFGANDIVFFEENFPLLAIAIQNTLNTSVVLNGGVLWLQDDLKFGDNAIIKNGGFVVFNNRRLSLGGTAATWESEIIWDSALDLQINSQTRLNGTWIFRGDGQINGNGNVLDISGGGTIFIDQYSTLRLSGAVLRGLGSGNFYMYDETSNLVLSDSEIEMDGDFTFNSGNVFVIGNSHVITGDKFLKFASNPETGTKGTLTIDSASLTYDTLKYGDRHNITPTPAEDPNEEYVKILGGGTIRTLRVESISFTSFGTNAVLQRYMILWPERPMTIYAGVDEHGEPLHDITIDGNTQFVGFSAADQPLLFVANDLNVVFENVFFRDFSPVNLSLGTNSSFVFGDRSTVKIWKDAVLNYPLVFQGNTRLIGGGEVITLGENGAIILKGEKSRLLIEGITIKNISGNKIRCETDSSKITFQDVKWVQGDDYSFGKGAFDVSNNFILMGYGYTFNFNSDKNCTIKSDSSMQFIWGITFNYMPSNGDLNLLGMVDNTSALMFNEAHLSAPNGIQLTKGRLIVQGICYAYNDDAANEAEGIIFGDRTEKNNLLFDRDLMFKQQSGFFVDLTV